MSTPPLFRVISLGSGAVAQQEKPVACSSFSVSKADEEIYTDSTPAADWLLEYDFLTSAAAHRWRVHLAKQQPTAQHLIVQAIEQKNVSGGKAGIKVVRFAKKHPELSTEAFRDYWRNQHGPIACASPWLYRYEQLHVDDNEYLTTNPPWDGFTLSYFESLSAMQKHATHPAGKAAAQDIVNFLAPGPLPFVIMKSVKNSK